MGELTQECRPAETPAGGLVWHYETTVGEVVLGTPRYGGLADCGFERCLRETAIELARRGIVSVEIGTEGESLVSRARNTIAAEFLARPNASHLVFIDGDIIWRAEDVVRLIAHDVPVIAGLYPKKKYPIEFVVHPAYTADGKMNRNQRTGAVQVANVGTGFLCIKREVFEQLAASGMVDKIERMDGISAAVLQHLYDYFPVFVDHGVLLSEDYGFCARWRATGGEVWVDPAIVLGHVGRHEFRGDPTTAFG